MTSHSASKPNLQKIAKPYCEADDARSWWQIANTIGPLLIMIVAAFWVQKTSLLMSIPFVVIGGLLITRTFIIMHDCGHGSFFKNKKTRDFVGVITGIICSTPYFQWTREHAFHHQHSGDLGYRGRGDVWTMTFAEYEKASSLEKFQYYLYRHPIVTFGIGPVFLFQFRHRITVKTDRPLERRNVHFTNFALALILGGLGFTLGFKNVFMVYLPMTMIAQLVGCLLFYVQHQYEEVYWSKGDKWSYNTAALEGCSYLKLPKVIQWFTGNIGFHHIHHLNHKIPNYKLEQCYNENGIFQSVETLTLSDMLPCIALKVYDESTGKMLTWAQVRQKEKQLRLAVA
jgi:omega-6 fatty acid desaturase (delta-12 desaturase)